MFVAALDEVTQPYGRAGRGLGRSRIGIRKGAVDLPVSGGPGTMGCFRVLDFRKDTDGKLVANTGDSFVFAVEFSQPPKAYTVVAYSQSDVEGSPHFSDQAAAVLRRQDEAGRLHRGRDQGSVAQELSAGRGMSLHKRGLALPM